ncbi:hypothetical protein Q4520_03010 [Alteromonas sp. 1_MG-2023]|uniref:hypothetical protein n=1 Tax=Alteromonas sp. 1_MG-2023 TaxID=3062669 RepID=UPI0026E1419B|nr:hypothetical protein [Alteromonas sp. 1_MG-2023]MDO6474370.1 hypothetical protein [Alteromonas sp. 1_MG-2023]
MILETLFFVIFGIVYFLVWVFSTDDQSSTENEQLDKLDDGMGNIIADGEHMTRQEAEDAQARGELYDTYY